MFCDRRASEETARLLKGRAETEARARALKEENSAAAEVRWGSCRSDRETVVWCLAGQALRRYTNAWMPQARKVKRLSSAPRPLFLRHSYAQLTGLAEAQAGGRSRPRPGPGRCPSARGRLWPLRVVREARRPNRKHRGESAPSRGVLQFSMGPMQEPGAFRSVWRISIWRSSETLLSRIPALPQGAKLSAPPEIAGPGEKLRCLLPPLTSPLSGASGAGSPGPGFEPALGRA